MTRKHVSLLPLQFSVGLVVCLLGGYVQATPLLYDPGPLNFSTRDQSLWGSGGGVAPVEKRYSRKWSSSSSLGGIAGEASTAVTVEDWHPGYAEDHGYTEWHKTHCHSVWCLGIDPHTPYPEWHPKLDWHPGYSEKHTLFTVDTRTGTEARFSSSGEVGVTSSLGFNGGTVDANLVFDARLNIPDEPVDPGDFFSLSPYADLTEGSFSTKFPTLTGEVTASLEADVAIDVEACILGAGCTTDSSSLMDVGPLNLDILEINTPGLSDKISLFGLDDLAFDITRQTTWVDFIVPPGAPSITLPGAPRPSLGVGMNLGNLTLDYPDLAVSGSLQADDLVVGSGQFDDLLRLNFDLDAAAVAAGSMPALGAVAVVGPLEFRGDIMDVDIGPTLDLSQSFVMDPELMVTLDFSQPVWQDLGAGLRQQVTSWSGPLADLPRFALINAGDQVEVRPEFWVDARFGNRTSLNFDLTFSLDVLKGQVGLSVLSTPTFSLVDIDEPIPLGPVDVFDSSFVLDGFSRISGTPFLLSAAAATVPQGPGLYTASFHQAPPAGVPTPGVLALMLVGLLGLIPGRVRWRWAGGPTD